MEFKEYLHIEKLGNTEVKGLLDGKCYIYPKLDGTNASVWWNNGLQAGSKKRQLTLEKDNAHFYEWALQDKALQQFFHYSFNRKYRLFGEWLVPHNLRTYEDTAWRRFYVFDIYREDKQQFLHYREYPSILRYYEIDQIPLIITITNPTPDELSLEVKKNKYLIKPNSGAGEGIVIKRYDYVNQYGRTTWAKLVRDEWKPQRSKKNKPQQIQGKVEKLICDYYVTNHLIGKTYGKIVNEMQGWSNKYIGRLLQTVFYDLVREEGWEMVKKFKYPTINFRQLKRLVAEKIKQNKPELF